MDEKAFVNSCTIINEGSKERPKVKALCSLESCTFFYVSMEIISR